jgi:rhodanese-related sulfurtransferase
VNIAGYVAENLLDDLFKYVRFDEIDEKVKQGSYLLDARTELEYSLGHIEGAKNIPLALLRRNHDSLPKDLSTPIYVYCNIGHTSYLAIQVLRSLGYSNLYNLAGGYKLYKALRFTKPLPKFNQLILQVRYQICQHLLILKQKLPLMPADYNAGSDHANL